MVDKLIEFLKENIEMFYFSLREVQELVTFLKRIKDIYKELQKEVLFLKQRVKKR